MPSVCLRMASASSSMDRVSWWAPKYPCLTTAPVQCPSLPRPRALPQDASHLPWLFDLLLSMAERVVASPLWLACSFARTGLLRQAAEHAWLLSHSHDAETRKQVGQLLLERVSDANAMTQGRSGRSSLWVGEEGQPASSAQRSPVPLPLLVQALQA